MLGDKRLEMPKTIEDAKKIFHEFVLITACTDEQVLFGNACRIFELNNEVYAKLHPKCTCAKCTGIDVESMFADE